MLLLRFPSSPGRPGTRLFMLFCLVTGFLGNPLSWRSLTPATPLVAMIAATMLILMTLLLARSKWATRLVFPIVYVLCGLGAYFGYYFAVPIRYDSIAWLLEASQDEISSFWSASLFLWLCASLVLSVVHIRLAAPLRALSLKTLLVWCVICLGLSLGLQKAGFSALKAAGYSKDVYEQVKSKNVVPFAIFKVFHVFAGEAKLVYSLKSLPGLEDMAFEAPAPADQPVVIFVMGESARADHFSINGYERETTPQLAREANLINYGIATSYDTSTRKSHYGMLTNATIATRTPTQGPVIPLYNAAGFRSYTFSFNAPLIQSGIITDVLTDASHERRYFSGRDHQLLPHIAEALAAPHDGGALFTLVTKGSHSNYRGNYDDEFRVFTPDDFTSTTMIDQLGNVRNAYDNTVVMTDDFLVRIMDLVRDRKAVLLYCSDHGESLGEDGVLFHGIGEDIPHHKRVPFLVWYSDAYAAAYPDKVAALRRHAAAPVNHDYLYHTLIGLGDIRSAGADPALDLTDSAALR